MESAIFEIPYKDERENGAETPCVICGREVKNPRYMIEMIDGGDLAAAVGLGPDEDDPGYMGFHYIGPECRRKLPANFIHDTTK